VSFTYQSIIILNKILYNDKKDNSEHTASRLHHNGYRQANDG